MSSKYRIKFTRYRTKSHINRTIYNFCVQNGHILPIFAIGDNFTLKNHDNRPYLPKITRKLTFYAQKYHICVHFGPFPPHICGWGGGGGWCGCFSFYFYFFLFLFLFIYFSFFFIYFYFHLGWAGLCLLLSFISFYLFFCL